MAPKKAATSASKKAAAPVGAHASYQDMIKEAILSLKERNGSSRQAIKKYIQSNNTLPKNMTDAQFSTHISRALAHGEETDEFTRPKGPSGPVKLAKKGESKTEGKKDKKPAAAKATKAKTGPKSSSAKPAAAKKAAPKKSATKAAPKKSASKPKANSAKPRKTATAAPAVEDKPVVLGKTKSGRVTKSTAPATDSGPKKASTAKKAAAKPKKAGATKEKTPKKESATPAAA